MSSYFLEPGHIAMVMMTPSQYRQMLGRMQPNLWPMAYAAMKGVQVLQDWMKIHYQVEQIQVMADKLETPLSVGEGTAIQQAEAGPLGDVDKLKNDILSITRSLYSFWQSGVYGGVGASWASALDENIKVGQLMYSYKTLRYHSAITPRMRRYWAKEFRPNELDAGAAWKLVRRKTKDISFFEERAAWDGWSKENLDLLKISMTFVPSPQQAFYMWAKGSIKEDKLHDLYFAGGFDSEWWPILTENWRYTPTLYDLVRLADYIELDQTWAVEKMRARGMRDADIAKVWKMLQIRPLREEYRLLTTHGLYMRQHAYWSHDGLHDYFLSLDLRGKEIELLDQVGDGYYEMELILERVEILRYKFRSRDITAEQFLNALKDPKGEIGMLEEKANLVVELEIAKGYEGY